MSTPKFGKVMDRFPSADGRSAEIKRRDFNHGREVLSEHWHEESAAVVSASEADEVISNKIVELIDGGITDTVNFVVHANPKSGKIDRVVTTHLVERLRP